MIRVACMFGLLIAAPVEAGDAAFPNKPGKKSAPRVVIGAQSGATTAAPADIVVGATSRSGAVGRGDYGFVASRRLGATPKRAVGYDPAVRFGNKRPNS